MVRRHVAHRRCGGGLGPSNWGSGGIGLRLSTEVTEHWWSLQRRASSQDV